MAKPINSDENIDVRFLKRGIYFVKLNGGNKVVFGRFTKT